MKLPLVTVITVTHNLKKAGREKYFRECLQSVRSQTYQNIEHIVVDGASTDGTLEIIKKYESMGWVKYISEPDTGIYNAMNKGISQAKGRYIAFLNSDDFYHNQAAVALSVKALEGKSADYSYANHRIVGRGQRYTDKADFDRFVCTMPFGHPTMFTKRSVLIEEGGFDETIGLPADYDLVLRLILKGYRSTYVDSEIASYRLGGASVITDYSDDVATLYIKNFSSFYHFSSAAEAKRIFLRKILPGNFLSSLESFARKKMLGDINIEKTAKAVEAAACIKNWGTKEKIKNILSHYPLTAIIFKKPGENR